MPGPFSGTPLVRPSSWLIGSCTHLYQSELGSTGEPGPPSAWNPACGDAPVEAGGERQVDAVDRVDVDGDGLAPPRAPPPGIDEVAEDRHELQQPERAVHVEARGFVADDHGELVGPPTAAIAFIGR